MHTRSDATNAAWSDPEFEWDDFATGDFESGDDADN